MPVLKEAAYYAALIKTNKYYFGFHSLIEAIGLSLEEGVELGKALKAEMNKRGLFSADHPADIEDALKSISNILATDPLWSAQAQAVNTLNSEFFSWGIRRLGRNYINAYRNKRKAKPEASETSDPDGKTESPPSKRARKATIALPVRLFANEVVYVRLPEGDMSIAAVDQFVDHSVETPDVSSVKPNSAGLQKFLHILSNLKTRPYVKGLHRVVCNLEGHVVRIDQNEGVFQAALVEMYERKVKKGLPMEFTISPISNTPRVTLDGSQQLDGSGDGLKVPGGRRGSKDEETHAGTPEADTAIVTDPGIDALSTNNNESEKNDGSGGKETVT